MLPWYILVYKMASEFSLERKKNTDTMGNICHTKYFACLIFHGKGCGRTFFNDDVPPNYGMPFVDT